MQRMLPLLALTLLLLDVAVENEALAVNLLTLVPFTLSERTM